MSDTAATFPGVAPDALQRPRPDGQPIAAGNASDASSDPAEGWLWRLECLPRTTTGAACTAMPDDLNAQLVALDAPLLWQGDHGSHATLPRLQTTHLANPTAEWRAEEDTRVIRLLWREGLDAELIARPLQGPMLLSGREGTRWLAWLLAGRAQWQLGDVQQPLAVNEPQWLPATRGRRMRLDGGGEIVLVRVSPPAPAGTSLTLES